VTEPLVTGGGNRRSYATLAREIQEELLAQLDLRRTDVACLADAPLHAMIGRMVQGIVQRHSLSADIDAARLIGMVLDEALGLGPLEPLLADASISEVMINGPNQVFVERHGRLEAIDASFSSDKTLRAAIERMVGAVGRRVDEASPMVDARLRNGSRVNVILPPLALRGPVVTIRKFSQTRLDMTALVEAGALSSAMAQFLRVAVQARRNIVVSGGTGAGKTTLLNAIAAYIPDRERVVTIEDAAELALHHPHVVPLESRPRNAEGQGEVSIRDLVRNALRMRPDRIIVGECRGSETLDMLQAMNTGHEGSLTTAHANSPRDLLARLEVMTLMAGVDLPLAAIRAQIAGAIDLIVQQVRLPSGLRQVSSIVEVTGLDSGVVQTQELFRFDPDATGIDGGAGAFQSCGQMPAFYERLGLAGSSQANACLFPAHGAATRGPPGV
jgi:pilus assembly protein CpaF